MLGFNDIYAHKVAREKRFVMQEMLISGILIWIPYHLINEKTIVNIIVIEIDAQLCTYLFRLQAVKSFPY